MSDEPTQWQHALKLARAGIPVFPTHSIIDGACTCGHVECANIAKHPATSQGFYNATCNEDKINNWFNTGLTRNLAISTGSSSQIIVIDVDSKDGGLDTYNEWETYVGWYLPDTLMVRTGSGGLHAYYAMTSKMIEDQERIKSRSKVLPGIDIKAEHGYVVCPPSLHKSGGKYQWIKNDMSPYDTFPQDIRSLIAPINIEMFIWLKTARGKRSSTHTDLTYSFSDAAKDGCPAGARDEFINEICFRWRKKNISYTKAKDALREQWEKMEQPVGNEFSWSLALMKLDRVYEQVTPNANDTSRLDAGQAEWLRNMQRSSGGSEDIENTPVTPTGIYRQADNSGRDRMPVGIDTGSPPPTGLDEEFTDDSPFRNEHATDAGNTARFVRLFKGKFIYVNEEKRWYFWNGHHWQEDRVQRVMHETLRVIEDIRETAELATEDRDRERWVAWARASESYNARDRMLRGAQPECAVTVEMLDADPWLLVVKNGTINLRTGELRASRPEDLNTKVADVVYDPEAECKLWDEHIDLISGNSSGLKDYLRRSLGYSLTGLVDAQKFFFLYGEGSNGKNATIETVAGILGEYACPADSQLISAGTVHTTILAELRGMRFVYADETESGSKFNDQRLKMITGSKTIKARYMRGNNFSFTNTIKLWIMGNNMPGTNDISHGMKRRLELVPFVQQIPEDRRQANFGETLRNEYSGILNWLLVGLQDWIELGVLGTPGEVLVATQDYFESNDILGQFIADHVVVTGSEDSFAPSSALYGSYRMWCGMHGEKIMSSTTFGTQLRQRLHIDKSKKKRINGQQVRGYEKIELIGVDDSSLM